MKKKKAQVFHYDLYGKREEKYDFLSKESINSIHWEELEPRAPFNYFVPKDYETKEVYDKGFIISVLFKINGVGLTTAHDDFVITHGKSDLLNRYIEFQNSPRDADFLHKTFNVREKKGWNILDGYDNISGVKDLNTFIHSISYRPFDYRFIFYEDKLVWRTVKRVMKHLIRGENIALAGIRLNKENDEVGYTGVFMTRHISEARLADRFITNIFPLYLYPDKPDEIYSREYRIPNLDLEIVNKIGEKLGLEFEAEKSGEEGKFAPIDLLDYIYAVLHSPTYREKYKEFLKIDFPRVPYPEDIDNFWQLVKLGGELRSIHLLENPIVENYITQYPVNGDNVVTRSLTSRSPGFVPKNSPPSEGWFAEQSGVVGRVYINDDQYFDNVPEIAWNFYIGGYQPAQKWLKDRRDRTLDFEDILHYQKIIVALTETDRLMREVDEVMEEWEIRDERCK